ncbi:hypothetical protein [Flammeovirga sp. EKP202]|uniref:hypothetical protein n=1 Tax=Flammeovirga sp. EKP202 TaxID=2770592 RepID=UPI00165FBD93|nr:hypothetical protein [Flammeovirga sp. EKP202]MBD0404017.1 hypothetical protein [Flammeovirga sp. EKP202]
MNFKLTFLFALLTGIVLSSCVDDVDKIPPREVTLIYNWEEANIAGLDSGTIQISHQAGLMRIFLGNEDKSDVVPGVIGNLIVQENPKVTDEKYAIPEELYIIPIGQDSAEIIFTAPKGL